MTAGAWLRKAVDVLLGRLNAAYGRKSAREEEFLSVESRLNLGPKKSLLLVRCGGRKFLVASGAESISAMIEVHRRPVVPFTGFNEGDARRSQFQPLHEIRLLGSVR